MTIAAGFFFPVVLALLYCFLRWGVFASWPAPQKGVWLLPIAGLFLIAGSWWLGSILYRGTVNRVRYPVQTIPLKPGEREAMNFVGSGTDPASSLKAIRAGVKFRKAQWSARLNIFACLLVAVCCFGYQQAANRESRALLTVGRRTQGTLQNITVTRHFPLFWLTGYSFNVSYNDQAGTEHRAQMEANEELFTKHTTGAGQFTHHAIEVVFRPEDPTVAGLPEALGGSIWGYVIAAILLVIGCFAYRIYHPISRLEQRER
jgi:hypothetical protein